MSDYIIPIHTKIDGRCRFNIHGLASNPPLKQQFERVLKNTAGIQKATASTITGHLLVHFDPALPLSHIVEIIQKMMAKPPPHPSPSPPDTKEETKPYEGPKNFDEKTDLHSQALKHIWYRHSAAKTSELLNSDPKTGLVTAEAENRRDRYGPNTLPEPMHRSKWSILMNQFQSLPVALLGIAAGLSVITGALVDAAVIIGVLGVNSVIGFVTENESEKTIRALKHAPLPPSTVLRDGKPKHIPSDQIVPGDVLILKPGTYISADARIINGEHLTIDESSLTGESLPVEKFTKALKKKDLPLTDLKNMAFMGTVVTGGRGLASVVATGSKTAYGIFHSLLCRAVSPKPPIEKKLDETGNHLVKLWGGVCIAVFGVGILRGMELLNMLRISVALAAAAVPEGLPAASTTTFALGIRKMRRYGILIRHLPAVETLGSIRTICFDKTGTITRNRMHVAEIFVDMRVVTCQAHQMSESGKPITLDHIEGLRNVLMIGALCSQVKINGITSGHEPELIGTSTENALIRLALQQGIDVRELRKSHPLLEVNHRSEKIPVMSSLHATSDDQLLYAVKGSPAEVLQMCSRLYHHGKMIDLSPDDRRKILMANNRMCSDALRVLGMAFAAFDNIKDKKRGNGLVWLGLVGMADPVREGVDAVIHSFHKAGINTIMITGDQALTAESVARKIKLSHQDPLEILDVLELNGVSDTELSGMVDTAHVFSRVSPAHKLKIVQALQKAGHVVAMTGDGINDGPALRAANVGIAMGMEGTDVARDVADVVLAKDNLDTIIEALRHGRTTYANIKKSVHFFLSTNFTEIMLMSISVAIGTGAPLTPMQLLWINIISDIFPGLSLAMEAPETDVMSESPRDSDAPLFTRSEYARMIRESAVISGHAMGAYAYGLWRYGYGMESAGLAFHTLTLGQLLHAFSCRSSRSIFQKQPPNPWLNAAMAASIGAHLLTMFVPGLRKLLNLAPLRLADFCVILAGSLLSLIINDSLKLLNQKNQKTSAPESKLVIASAHDKKCAIAI